MIDPLAQETIDRVVNTRYPQMSPDARHQLEKLLVKHEVRKGDIYLREGDICHNMLLVGQGLVRQFYFKNGKDVTEHFSSEGCIVMCIESMLKQQPSKLMIEALENSILYAIPFIKLMHLADVSYEVNMLYRKVLEYSLIVSQQKADSLRFESAKERYLHLLKQQPEVVKRAPLIDIASYLLMSPETLSRVRASV